MILEHLLKEQPNILIVDDLASARKVFVKLLQKLGLVKITEAKDGAIALGIVQSGNVDLVISDREMPNLDGIGLLKALRSDNRFSKIPFIIVTSQTDKESVKLALDSGVSDFVLKPFSMTMLEEKLNRFLGKKSEA